MSRFRAKMSKSSSKRNFKRGTRIQNRNTAPLPMRGGIRL